MPKITVFSVNGATVHDDRSLDEARAESIAAIKAEAEQRILAIAPVHRQLNAQARATELLMVRVGGAAWSKAEAAEAAALQAVRDAILAIRMASNEAEATVRAARSNDDADGVVPAWPKTA